MSWLLRDKLPPIRGDYKGLAVGWRAIDPLGDLVHRVTLEIVAEIGFAHVGLLHQSLGETASTNLAARQDVSPLDRHPLGL